LQTGQIGTSSFISNPIQKNTNVKTSSSENVIHPADEILRSTTGK
jgi:hypothetical protein